jgi:hypothetical protein
MRRALLVIAIAVLGAPTQADAATLVGSTTGYPGSQGDVGSNTYAYTDGWTGWTTPSGVITRWHINVGGRGGRVRLRVLQDRDDGTFAATASSAIEPAFADRLSTFAARIPVQSGDIIALDDFDRLAAYDSNGRGELSRWGPPLEDGQVRPRSGTLGPRAMLVSAEVEADSDGDGFGDETQDACPGDKSKQGGCGEAPPPPAGPAPEPQPSTPAQPTPAPSPVIGVRIERPGDARVLRRKGIVLTISSATDGLARLRIWVKLGDRPRALLLGPQERTLKAGQTARVRIRAGRRALTTFRRALARGATLTGEALVTLGGATARTPVTMRR